MTTLFQSCFSLTVMVISFFCLLQGSTAFSSPANGVEYGASSEFHSAMQVSSYHSETRGVQHEAATEAAAPAALHDDAAEWHADESTHTEGLQPDGVHLEVPGDDDTGSTACSCV